MRKKDLKPRTTPEVEQLIDPEEVNPEELFDAMERALPDIKISRSCREESIERLEAFAACLRGMDPSEKKVPVSRLQYSLSHYLNQVSDSRSPVFISRRGEVTHALIPISAFSTDEATFMADMKKLCFEAWIEHRFGDPRWI